MHYGTVYEVYNGEELVFKGLQREIWARFNIKTPVAHYANTGYKIDKIYSVKACGKAALPENREKMNRLDYLVLHLVKRGLPNTTCDFDPSPFIDDLKEAGIEVKITKYEPGLYYSTLCKPRRGRKKYAWLVEKK